MVTSFVVSYLVTSFIKMDATPMDWSESERVWTLVIAAALTFARVIIVPAFDAVRKNLSKSK